MHSPRTHSSVGNTWGGGGNRVERVNGGGRKGTSIMLSIIKIIFKELKKKRSMIKYI